MAITCNAVATGKVGRRYLCTDGTRSWLAGPEYKYNGKLAREVYPPNILDTKPADGVILHQGWGGNRDASTWRIVNMTQKPELFKVVDDNGKNIITDFKTELDAQKYIDYHLFVETGTPEPPSPAPVPPSPEPEPTPPSPPSPSPPQTGEGFIDEDGVKILFPIDESGPTFSLQKDGLAKMDVDDKSHKMVGDVLEVISRTGGFASRPGVINYTSRTHARINDAKQITGLKKAQEAGSIIPAPFFRDMEITVVVETLPVPKENWTETKRSHEEYMEEYNDETHSIKFGGNHSDAKETALSNSLNLPYLGKGQGSKGLCARETTHPSYDFFKVNVEPGVEFPGNGPKITGLKGIRYNIPGGVHYEMWFDKDPIDENGKMRNNWVKAWTYEDKSADAHTFGVRDVTYRADMAEKVRIHKFNVRAIKPKI